jgi:DNA-binding LacI/PurR family transcriptional regulator
MIIRNEHLTPGPSLFPRSFLEALESEGIKAGSYNVPIWDNHPAGLRNCLNSLFKFTPPTALIVDESPVFLAVRDHLARRGIIAPRDLSLVCTEEDPSFAWNEAIPAHFRWQSAPVARRVVRWSSNVAAGKKDLRQSAFVSEFVEGGTIGPVPVGSR